MRKVHLRRYMIPVAVLAAFGLLFWAGCSKDLMSPDELPPRGSMITNPVDESSLNTSTINVRGRAEVGSTIDVFVNDEPKGSAVSSPAVPNDGLGGRFTVQDVELGEEGEKVIRARVTDLYGNPAAADTNTVITITLDQTAPPVELVPPIDGAERVDTLGYWGDHYWRPNGTEITISGVTDNTAAGARLRYGVTALEADELQPDTTGVAHFSILAEAPALSGGSSDTLITYYLEAYDLATNVNAAPVYVRWVFEGREEELMHDDEVVNSFDHTVTGTAGDQIAVRFQAPTWANYVTKFIFYSANDQTVNPIDSQLPSTKPFTAWVWRCTGEQRPGLPANDGYVPFTEFYMYPEDDWVEVTFPNAVDITNGANFPDKQFFVGLEWEYRLSPHIYEDHSLPIDYCSFLKIDIPNAPWDPRLQADTMIHAVVSDVPVMGEGREAVLRPVRGSVR